MLLVKMSLTSESFHLTPAWFKFTHASACPIPNENGRDNATEYGEIDRPQDPGLLTDNSCSKQQGNTQPDTGISIDYHT